MNAVLSVFRFILSQEALPPTPLSGMIKQDGGPVRLTFKLETDELWIGTKERTHKLPMNSIKRVHSEPITDQEEYSIVGIQTGPTVKSTIWVYWVPSQYIDAIKDTILGSFLFWVFFIPRLLCFPCCISYL